MRRGGRWNAPGSFATVYLAGDLETARAIARFQIEKLVDMPFTADDLDPEGLPVLVSTEIAGSEVRDLHSSAGIADASLPPTYPIDSEGHVVSHSTCQPIGRATFDAGVGGISCRSAVPGAPHDGSELAWFDDIHGPLTESGHPSSFADWYGVLDL
jgi:hypothetical protein